MATALRPAAPRELVRMSGCKRAIPLFWVVAPFVAVVAAVVLLWNRAVGPVELAVMAAMYAPTMLGITVGFHRLFTHHAFETTRPIKYALAICGSMAVQGSVVRWVAEHRKHHECADREGDPHSPHGHGPGRRGALAGLWHAQVGWLFRTYGLADAERYAPEFLDDRDLQRLHAAFPLLVGLSLLLPFAAGLAITGTLDGGLQCLLWGGLVRVFLVHHAEWSVNSLGHFAGKRRFRTDDRSTNLFWLAIPSMGESWHHNHHAFPRSATFSSRWWEIDPGGYLITLLERLGLAWNVTRITPERRRQRLVSQ
jgi:stearoyl-CoA desaturase (delta-9 desaturase)